ncbi:hypothetical protein OS493_018190 [Desmophyllum pertusum]|uniref:Uncharacterized protein n=1 Tax=Desmophyllum pertusum TaxID=174260 RepID=A0A9W9YNP6_9CNID|nr:hypothetical protein OS493_018190 [Desmophyllum pertusum]
MGLASASGCDIQLVYPDNRHSLTSLLSALYRPRVGSSKTANICIMWTDTAGWPNRLKEFKSTLKTTGSPSHESVRLLKTTKYDEKKRRSPANQTKTGTLPQNSPPPKNGIKEYFRSDNRPSKKGTSSAPNTRQGSHASSRLSASKSFSSPHFTPIQKSRNMTESQYSRISSPPRCNKASPVKLTSKPVKVGSNTFGRTGTPNTNPGKAQNKSPSSSVKSNYGHKRASPTTFENQSPAGSNPHDSCDENSDSFSTDGDTQLEPSLVTSDHSESGEAGVESPNVGNAPDSLESDFNPGSSSPTSNPTVGTQNTNPGKAQNKSPSSSVKTNYGHKRASPTTFENQSPAGSNPHDSCDENSDSFSTDGDTQLETSLVTSDHSESGEAGVESPNVGNAPDSLESDFNPGSSSPTSNPTVGTQNPACETGETGIDSQNSFTLPLTAVGRSFYKKRGKLYHKNLKRRLQQQEQISTSEEGKQMLDVLRSNVKGTLQENIASLENKIRFGKSQHHLSQLGTLAVANYILEHGPLLPTTELCNVYKKAKGSSSKQRMMSAELFRILSKHLNIMQLYIEGQAFICENTQSDFEAILSFVRNQVESRKHLFERPCREHNW